MVEIKLKPGMKFKYKGIDFICLDIINGNYLAITAKCWCINRFNEKYEDGCNNAEWGRIYGCFKEVDTAEDKDLPPF